MEGSNKESRLNATSQMYVKKPHKKHVIHWALLDIFVCWPPGTGRHPGDCASLRPVGEGPAWAGASTAEPVGPSAGGGGLFSPAGPPQRQVGGRVRQPQERPGPAGECSDCSWTSQTGRSVWWEIFFSHFGRFTGIVWLKLQQKSKSCFVVLIA